tara:strand:+ start:443 stop:1150 length:708 start_codon:yes stop_codon:yes gene_type:complete
MNLGIKRIEPEKGAFKMPNNLELMITKSGMLRKDVAERMGIRPETVSRHLSGGLQFSISQAEQYAMILQCNPQDILFAQKAVPLFGTLDADIVTAVDPSEAEISYYVDYPVDEHRRFVISKHTASNKQWANGRLYSFSGQFIKKQKVDDNSFMRLCIFKVKKDRKIRFGVIYPEPGGTYAVGLNSDSHTESEQGGVLTNAAHKQIARGLELSWCTPILSCVMQPDLLGVVLKEHE